MIEDGSSFPQWLANREDLRADHSIGALREKVCENAWNEGRLCFVHVNEGCRSCDSMPRPTRDEWQKHIAECPLSERERTWIARYERSLYERRAAVIRGAPHWGHHSRQRSQSPLNVQRGAATRLPARPLAHLFIRFRSRVVVITSHPDILSLDDVYIDIALCMKESVYICKHVKMK